MSRAVALCYLNKQGDEKNKCQLFDDQLEIIYKGKSNLFLLDHKIAIHFEKKLMILPLVFGGAGASLLAMAIFLNRINPWIGLSLLFMALLVIYVGIEGRFVMIVSWGKTTQIFPLRSVSPNLRAFVNFFHDYTDQRLALDERILLYHVTDQKNWRMQDKHSTYVHISLQNEGFIHASTRNQILDTFKRYYSTRKADYVLLEIDPLKLQSTVKYEESAHNHRFYPHIYGPIHKDAIIRTNSFHTAIELQQLLQ